MADEAVDTMVLTGIALEAAMGRSESKSAAYASKVIGPGIREPGYIAILKQ